MHKMFSASTAAYVAYVLLVHQTLSQEACTELTFHDFKEEDLSVVENQFVNVTFWVNVSTCNEKNTSHKIIVRTRTKTGSLEYDGTITYWKDTCTERQGKSVQCISPTGPAELNRTVNRSHVQIEWELTFAQSGHSSFVLMNLTVLCKPQFIKKSPNLHPGIYQRWEFNIKAYTTVVDKCILVSLSSGENWRKEVNCTLTGDPPNLNLTVVILNDSITGGNWSLNISIEGGLSETLFSRYPQAEGSGNSSTEATENDYTSMVVQEKMRQQQGLKTDVAEVANVGASAEIMEASSICRHKRSDGLIYGDLDFTTTSVSDTVNGTMLETEYAALNFSAIVPPPLLRTDDIRSWGVWFTPGLMNVTP
ncbi:hypothetical protein C0Q70_12346, partial [Pomacea canaliculata]